MEIINNRYIKIDKTDIFYQLVELSESKNTYMSQYFQTLLSTMFEYEKENKLFVKELYLNRDDFSEDILLNINIKRHTLLNAYVIANLNGNADLAAEIGKLLNNKEVTFEQLGDLKEFILDHCININEYYDGEVKKIIYNSKENTLEKGYIYNFDKAKIKQLNKRNIIKNELL